MKKYENKPDVSVLMACFNAEKYVRETIESVLNQTFMNFEFIIINDGSTDKSLEIIKSFKDERIVLIDQDNKGLTKSLNTGLAVCKGKYIARIDADDICLHKRFEIQHGFLEANPTYVLVSSAVLYIDEEGVVTGRSFPVLNHKSILNSLKSGNPIAHPTVMIKKETLIDVGGYNEVIKQHFEDYFLWVKLIELGKFKTLSTPLIKYRITENSLSVAINDELRRAIRKLSKKEDILIEDYDNLLCLKEKSKKAKTKSRINFLSTYKIFVYFPFISKLICYFKSVLK